MNDPIILCYGVRNRVSFGSTNAKVHTDGDFLRISYYGEVMRECCQKRVIRIVHTFTHTYIEKVAGCGEKKFAFQSVALHTHNIQYIRTHKTGGGATKTRYIEFLPYVVLLSFVTH